MASKARAAGQAQGRLKAALTEYQEVDWKRRIAQQESEWKSKEFDKQVGMIGDTLSLASSLYGSAGEKMGDVAELEKQHGKLQTKDYGSDFMGKLKTEGARIGRAFQLSQGQGKFTFGEGDAAKTIAGRDISTQAGLARTATSKPQPDLPKKPPTSENDIKDVNQKLAETVKENKDKQIETNVKQQEDNEYKFTYEQNTWLKKQAGADYARREGEGTEQYKSRRQTLWDHFKLNKPLNQDTEMPGESAVFEGEEGDDD